MLCVCIGVRGTDIIGPGLMHGLVTQKMCGTEQHRVDNRMIDFVLPQVVGSAVHRNTMYITLYFFERQTL